MATTITFADNQAYPLISAFGRNEMVSSLSDLMAKSDREVIELHFDSTAVGMEDLQKYYINPDDTTALFTITDDDDSKFVHQDYVIPVKFSLEYVGTDPNPHIILVLAQLNETDKSLREVAGKQKVYTGTDLEIAIAKKLDELSADCHDTIEAGFDYNGSHYSLTKDDQTNILALRGEAKEGKAVLYHADDEDCRPYLSEEFINLSNAAMYVITHNTTYFNFLKKYVKTLTDIEVINAIEYGVTELTGEYLEKYNKNMALLTE